MGNIAFSYRLETPFTSDKIRAMREAQIHVCIANNVPDEKGWDIVALADELCCNIIEHSDASWMEFELSFDDKSTPHLAFRDNGRAFNPTEIPDLPADHERGMGLGMVQSISGNFSYSRTSDGTNQVLVTAGD